MRNKIHISLNEELETKMKSWCDLMGVTVSDFVRVAVGEKIARLQAAAEAEQKGGNHNEKGNCLCSGEHGKAS